ncbi:tetratricopeptide repeat protein [Methanobrevibacter millerae]|uniref:Tetratricopeptide repeat-containing protein n=1 Tax=Methanobrevibacter millerae TaxID=230361 RepID=A0A1G5WH01_9EURY|nr:tetratricopeptide repeat protein [Methanobrevibacter millerae]SDA57174.1 Tetratricopeptide repeat-containing protein [Methanobrevibacter millerae]
MANYIDKYKIKNQGLKFEKEEPEKAIEYYKELLTHEYFINDFWLYRRLVLMYKKTKEFDKKTEIIKTFFRSGIYCNNHQFLWFRNKLRILSEKNYITPEEIDSLTNYFKTHSLINEEKANTPLPIADRIKKRNGEIIVISKEKYDKKQKQYEYEVKCSELNRQQRYDEYIELLNYMIDDLGYRRYGYFQKLCVAYRRFNDYDNELRIINKYMNGESARTKVSDEWFEKRLKDVEKIINPNSSNKELNEIKTLKEENKYLSKRISELEDKKPNVNYQKISDLDEKSIYEIPFNIDDLNLVKYPDYEYDSTLNEFKNLKRKNILIQYGRFLTQNKQTNDAIKFYKNLCDNTYFSNDWYPYRQLTIIYDKKKDYHANLSNIKDLFHSNIYLNRYQHVWFSEKIRRILEKVNVNENEIEEWFEYYETHGALNEKESNKFLADKFVKLNDRVFIITDEYFNYRQESYALEEIGRIYERVGNYELAISHYEKIIAEKEYPLFKFYQRICFCLEKLKDYNRELDAIELYYTDPPMDVSEYSDEWFEKRLKKVNKKLNTDYTVDELKSIS